MLFYQLGQTLPRELPQVPEQFLDRDGCRRRKALFEMPQGDVQLQTEPSRGGRTHPTGRGRSEKGKKHNRTNLSPKTEKKGAEKTAGPHKKMKGIFCPQIVTGWKILPSCLAIQLAHLIS